MNEIKNLKILSLNVCGLVSKLKCPEFVSLINEYDLVGIQETKTDDVDSHIDIPGYDIYFHNRDNISRYRSGGIALIVKKKFMPFNTVDKQTQASLFCCLQYQSIFLVQRQKAKIYFASGIYTTVWLSIC